MLPNSVAFHEWMENEVIHSVCSEGDNKIPVADLPSRHLTLIRQAILEYVYLPPKAEG